MIEGSLERLERVARVFNVQKYNMHDGPGVRTLVFFKGCPLRCKWCSNPESWLRDYQVMFKRQHCVNCGACVRSCPVGIHVMNAEGVHELRRNIKCIGCRSCEKACLHGALQIVGEDKTISTLLEIVDEDRDFYAVSGGGVTLGGGEVSAQHEAATSLLMACKQEGFHTAIETCGYCKTEHLMKMAEYIDLFLFDIKHMDPLKHKELTGVNNELILKNLRELLDSGKQVKIRMPLLKGINDSKEEIFAVINFLKPYKFYKNFEGVDLLPYHKMGVAKYQQLDLDYPVKDDPSLSLDELERIEAWIRNEDFPVNLLRH